MQRLLCLGLEGQPAAELITGTARVWTDHLGSISRERLAAAFDAVEQNAKRWPSIGYIRECLPSKAFMQRLGPEKRIAVEQDPVEAAAHRERIRKMIEETARRLGEKDEPELQA